MKNRFNRIISFICAVMMICAVCAWTYAEEASATPTDLSPAQEIIPEVPESEQEPAQEPGQEPSAEPAEEVKDEPIEEPAEEPETELIEEPAEEPVASVEVVITKSLSVGGSWDGKVGKTKPAILKLDIKQPCSVHMLVEGKDVWATVEKTDRRTDNPPRTETDPETDRTIISWEAEVGSYLITLGPVEPNLLGIVSVTFMDNKTYTAWEADQEEKEPEPETEPEPEPEPEQEPEKNPEETPEEEPIPVDENTNPVDEDAIPDNEENIPTEPSDDIPSEAEESASEEDPQPQRHINVEVTWDVPDPMIGDTAHFKADLSDYEGLTYTIQWQYGPDNETWYDLPGETAETMDVVVNEENNLVYWRILVFLEEEQ